MPKISTLKALYENHKKADDWIATIPYEVSDPFFDTPYINGLQSNIDLLISEVFGEYSDSVDWLLNEWGKGFRCEVDGEIFGVDSPEEYYQYLIDHEGWEE